MTEPLTFAQRQRVHLASGSRGVELHLDREQMLALSRRLERREVLERAAPPARKTILTILRGWIS